MVAVNLFHIETNMYLGVLCFHSSVTDAQITKAVNTWALEQKFGANTVKWERAQ